MAMAGHVVREVVILLVLPLKKLASTSLTHRHH